MIACGCQATVISSSWRDESFRKESVRKVFIISHLKNDLLRRKAEDSFAKQLQRHGVDSLQSYKFFEEENVTDKAEVTRRIKREGCSNVLVAKLLDEKTVKVDNRQMCTTPREWGTIGWYQPYDEACNTPYIIDVDILRIETALFDAETDRLLWATQTHTELTSNPTDKDIEDWVKLVLKSMLKK
jgi:hypothetical protein